jgi:hypothetical protein
MFTPPPDGFIIEKLLVFERLGSGGHVSQGFWIDLPDLQHASETELNSFHDRLQRLTLILPEQVRFQIQFDKDSDYQPELLTYQKDTARSENTAVKRRRNLTFLRFWELMKRGELRRHRMAIFIGRSFDAKGRVPWRRRSAERFYRERLTQCESEFSEYAGALKSLFTSLGGTATPMSEADYFRLFVEKLNPGVVAHGGGKTQPEHDPSRSILDNVWNSPIRGQRTRGFWLDETYHGVLVLRRWPVRTYPGIEKWLTQLPFNDYSITVQLRREPLSRLIAPEQKSLNRVNRLLAAKPDERLTVTRTKLEERIQRLSQGDQVPLTVEYILTVRAPNPELLAERILAAKSAIHGMPGANYYEAVLPASAKNWFWKTLPGWMWSRHQGIGLYAENTYVTDMLPLTCTAMAHLSSAEALYSGTHGNVIGLKTFAGLGLHAMPLNFLIFGSPGSGKSVFALDLLFQTAPFYAHTFIIEEGRSHFSFTRSFGIEPIIFRPGGREAINCFDTRKGPWTALQLASLTALVGRMAGLPADEDKAHHRLALIEKSIKQLVREFADDQVGRLPQQERRALVRRAKQIHQLATERNLTFLEAFTALRDEERAQAGSGTAATGEGSDSSMLEFESAHPELVRDLLFSTLEPGQHLRLSALREHLELNASGSEREACQQIATLLGPFTGDGAYATLFDRPTNVSLEGRVVHFELGMIPEAAKELKQLIGFLITNDVRQFLTTLPLLARKQIVIEELGRFIDVPGGVKIVRELYEQMRKLRVAVMSIMQQYSRITDPSLRAALVGCSASFCIFNPQDRTDLATLARDIGLSTAAQERTLKYARPCQMTGQKYSEFTFFHPNPQHPICCTVRHHELAEPAEANVPVNEPSTPN